MAIIETHVEWDHDTNLPEDVIVHTFHFEPFDVGGDVPETSLDGIQLAVQRFYTAEAAGYTFGLAGFLSPALSGQARIIMWNLSDPSPRVPVREFAFTASVGSAGAGAIGLPEELAVVLSYRAAAVSGVPPARLRGRLYFGPLSSVLFTAGDATQPSVARPPASFLDQLGDTAARLVVETGVGFDAGPWVVYSAGARNNSNPAIPYEDRPLLAPLASDVVAGHVDNAFDIQRRRGVGATLRNLWPD